MELQKLAKKTDGFYFDDQKLNWLNWPFESCMQNNTIRDAWVLLEEKREINRAFLSIGQCCTGLLITFYKGLENPEKWLLDITQLPICVISAELSPTEHYFAGLKVTGEACNAKGTIQILGPGHCFEWVNKERG